MAQPSPSANLLPPPGEEERSLRILSRSVRVLKCVARSPEPPRLAEIARHTSLPKASLHRLLAVLVRLDLLDRNDDVYSLGDAVTGVGHSESERVIPHELLRMVLAVSLIDLYESTNVAVSLNVLTGMQVVRLLAYSGSPQNHQVNQPRPAYCTAAGKLLLAHRGRLAADLHLKRRTEHTITDPQDMARELSQIRARGLALDHQEYEPGIVGLAAGVTCGPDLVAAIELTGTSRDFGRPDLEGKLRLVARRASRALSTLPM